MEDAADAGDSDIPPDVQIAVWGITDAARRDLAALVRGGCVLCGAARRAEFAPNPAVRAASGRFTALVRAMAQTSLPFVDCAAVAATFWGKQRNTPYSYEQRVDRVLAHIFYCGDSAWALRVTLARCNLQAVAAMAYIGRHGLDEGACGGAAVRSAQVIAKNAKAAISMYRLYNPGAVMPVHAPPDVPPARVRKWCVLCHGSSSGAAAAAVHEDLYGRYTAMLKSGRYGRMFELAEALADAATESDQRALGRAQDEIARDSLAHYVLHDASPAALVHRLVAITNTLSTASLDGALAFEGGTLSPNVRGEAPGIAAREAVVQLAATVARVHGTAEFGGMPLYGLAFAQSS